MADKFTYGDLNLDFSEPIEEREKRAEEAIKLHPDCKDWISNALSIHLMQAQLFEKAIYYGEQAVKYCTDQRQLAEYYYNLSCCYSWQDKYKEAIPYAEKAVELSSDRDRFIVELGELYTKAKDYKKALEIFQELLSMTPDEETDEAIFEFYDRLAAVFEGDNDFKEANKIFNKMLKDAVNDEQRAMIYSLISEMQTQQNNYKDAITNAKKAVKFAPDRHQYLKRLGTCYYNNNQKELAEEVFLMLQSFADRDFDNRIWHLQNFYHTIAPLYVELKRYDEAIDCYKKSLELWEDPQDSYFDLEQLSAIYFNRKQYKKMKVYLERIIKIFPNQYPRAYTSMATYYHEELEDKENALNYLHLALEANCQDDKRVKGNDPEIGGIIWAIMGDIYYHSYKDIDKAIEYYERVMQCKPPKQTEARVCDNLYEIYMNLGDEEKAKEYKEKRTAPKQILDMFGGGWTPPPPKTLHERLRNPKNKKEEIENLPYYYSKIPNDEKTVNKSIYMKQLDMDFENDLLTNEKYKEFFDKHDPFYNRNFIREYVKHKIQLVNGYKYYLDKNDDVHEYYLNKKANYFLEVILQKKLFNMQLQWRAGQIKIEEIRTSYDFNKWNHRMFECPLVTEITEQELTVMKDFIMNPNFDEDETYFFTDWQEPNALMGGSDEDGDSYYPPFYEFYDERMNTGHLLLLPDTKGEKEKEYIEAYWKWHRKQPADSFPVPPPYTGPVIKSGLFATDDTLTEFMEIFEDDYLCTLHQNWLNQKQYPDKEYPKEEIEDAISTLEYAKITPVIEVAGIKWYDALIQCAKKYKQQELANKLDEMFAQYKMNQELKLFNYEEEYGVDSQLEHIDTMTKQILKGREFLGEKADFDY